MKFLKRIFESYNAKADRETIEDALVNISDYYDTETYQVENTNAFSIIISKEKNSGFRNTDGSTTVLSKKDLQRKVKNIRKESNLYESIYEFIDRLGNAKFRLDESINGEKIYIWVSLYRKTIQKEAFVQNGSTLRVDFHALSEILEGYGVFGGISIDVLQLTGQTSIPGLIVVSNSRWSDIDEFADGMETTFKFIDNISIDQEDSGVYTTLITFNNSIKNIETT